MFRFASEVIAGVCQASRIDSSSYWCREEALMLGPLWSTADQWTVLLPVLLALVLSTAIGLERGYPRWPAWSRPAGATRPRFG